jgi:hypothetical protein
MNPSASRSRAEPVSVEDLISRLEAVRRVGEGRWMARCPAHGDRGPSLSIRQGEDGRILLHDFSGCTASEVVAALGLELRQLFAPSTGPWRPRGPRPDPDSEACELIERLRAHHRPPPPGRVRWELALLGRVLLGGARGGKMRTAIPAGFNAARDLRTFALKLMFQAAEALAAQGTPRRWFHPEALWREVQRAHGGREWRAAIYLWSRAAISAARAEH